MAQILDGRIVRDKIAKNLKSKILNLKSKPKLVIIQVGDLEQSNSYIRRKVLFGQKIGAIVEVQKFPESISPENLLSIIHNLNSSSSVHGIVVQQPLPQNLDKDEIIETIDPKKDVDGQTATNIKLLFENSKGGYTPATAKGIFTLLDFYKIPAVGKHVVVVGRSTLVGKPTALLALNKNATVTIAHSKTHNLPAITKSADILIVAAGHTELITKDYVSKGQVVIDVGINIINHNHLRGERSYASKLSVASKPETEISSRKLVGDVDFDQVSKVVKAISPVPGGVGPMTVASLFENLLIAYRRQT